MAFLIGSMCKHIDGKKNLTDKKQVVSYFDSKKVYIPLFHANSKIELVVKEGDRVKVGTKIAEGKELFYVPLFSSVSGTVLGVESRMHSSMKKLDHLVIENDGKFEEEKLPTLDYRTSSAEDIALFIKEKGILGQGGAGFPTYVKYVGAKGIHTVIINAVECEPFITSDYFNIKMNLDFFKEGVLALFKASNAKKVQVAIKKDKVELIDKLKSIFKENKEVEIVGVPNVYPMGWERTLIYALTKKRYDRLPSELGLIVSNATTALAFGKALITGIPITTKMITVSGNAIANPSNVLCPVGTIVNELLTACGGTTKENIQLIAGGPMMGTALTIDEFVITPYSNALTVLEYEEIKENKCLRCGACIEVCPSGLQPVNIANAEKTKNIEALVKLHYEKCIECGLCTYICPSKIAVTEKIRVAKRNMALRRK